jgi:hypothetical protein
MSVGAKISELLDDIRTQDLVLPEFQREYVWTGDQAKQLMVSLVKSYPVGGLLIWNRVLQDYRAIATDWSQPGVEMIKPATPMRRSRARPTTIATGGTVLPDAGCGRSFAP